jgi:hypothetical protein
MMAGVKWSAARTAARRSGEGENDREWLLEKSSGAMRSGGGAELIVAVVAAGVRATSETVPGVMGRARGMDRGDGV